MAALDFPSSPTDGQVFGNWVYNLSKQAWQSKPLTPAKTVNSPTAPASPADGDQWFNTNNGSLYIYYTDANGSQWVESRAPITADGYISPNYVINGGMDIWQRSAGPVSAGTGGYIAADRWYVYNNATATTTVAKETTIVPTGFSSSYKITQTGTTANVYLMQSHETAHTAPLVGKTVTLSAYVYGAVATTFSIGIRYDTATVDKSPASGFTGNVAASSTAVTAGTWTRITTTGVVPLGTKTIRTDVYVMSPTLGQPFYVTGVQLEEGPIATPFRRNANSIAGELAACQRYFATVGSNSTTIAMPAFTSTDANLASVATKFPVTMRTTPASIITYDFAGTAGNAHRQYVGSSGGSNVAVSVSTKNADGFNVNTNIIGVTDRAGMYYLWYKADAEI